MGKGSGTQGGARFDSLRIGQIALACVMLLLCAAAVSISVMISQRQQTLEGVSRYNITWSVGQAVREVNRLEQRIAIHALPGSAVDDDDVALCFDILESRVGTLRAGEVHAFVRSHPEFDVVIARVADAVEFIRPFLGRLRDPGIALSVLRRLDGLDVELMKFASAAHHFSDERVSIDQGELLRLHHGFSVVAGGLITCGIGLLGLAFWHIRLLRRAHGRMSDLAETLSRTSVSKEYLDDIVNGMSEGLLVVATATGRIEAANNAAARLTGVPVDWLVREPISAVIPTADEHLDPLKRRETDGYRSSSELATAAGTRVPIGLSVARMPDGEDGEARIVCVFRSLVDQQRAEAEQLQLREQLYQAQKMQAIGTLAGGIAHDFNNILGGILGHCHLALDGVSSRGPLYDGLTQIKASAERATALVRQILTYSRHAEFVLRPLDAMAAVEQALDGMRSTLPGHVEVRVDLAEAVTIEADPTQLGQIVANLVINAAHAIGDAPGEIKVSVERVAIAGVDPVSAVTRRKRAWFGQPAAGSYCRIVVADTGCGMDEVTMARIFEPFFTTKEVGKGTGLGLATVHGILDNHKAVASIESAPGLGTIFEIYLPESERAIEATVVPMPPAAAASGRERILLVDDDRTILAVTRQTLIRLGYEVTAFDNPEQALEAFRNDPQAWDLALTDRNMPNLPGDDLARALLAIRSDLPVIMATGFASAADEQRMRELGVADFLFKPVFGDALSAAVRSAFDRVHKMRNAA